MALWDKIKGQLRSVIEWENADNETLFYQWSADGDEIKNASKLIVKPGQGVIFVYEGRVEAVHLKEGLYELKTANIPFLTTLFKFMQAFESEHKVGIYYFWQTEFLNQKWGTASPIKYLDPMYGFPVGLRSFGNMSFKISAADKFFVNVVGSRSSFAVADLRSVFVSRLVQPLTDTFATSGFSYVDIDKNRTEIAAKLQSDFKSEFTTLGFELTDFRIEGTEFDDDTQGRINTIANIQAEAFGAKAAGINYAQMQQLKALREAAANPGGAAGAGVSLGAGVGLGQMMAGQMAGMMGAPGMGMAGGVQSQAATQAGPSTPLERIKQLDELKNAGVITQEEYDSKRAEILKLI